MAVANGLFGDTLEGRDPRWSTPMTIRAGDTVLPSGCAEPATCVESAVINPASAALWALPIPTTRLVGLGLDRRSAGIKGLRFGAIVEEDWIERDPTVAAGGELPVALTLVSRRVGATRRGGARG